MTAQAETVAELRHRYRRDLAPGVERFFEPRRVTCPWCSSDRLRERLRTTDLIQHKPGTFVVEECRACGHRFQNPRLTPEGLDFYYRDFYDGLGARTADLIFRSPGSEARHRAVARSVAPFTDPRRWLDVGTGHGHFPKVAKEVFPRTAFDGLDLGEGVETAAREGRIEEAHRGSFTELADGMAGHYDVVSMHHYLEHTPDPRRQLTAARTALRPGGLLLVEVPNPESAYATLLGRWWLPWFQPQHLHLIPSRNLRGAVCELGFTVVTTERGAAHQPVDLAAAVALRMFDLMPRGDAPWHPGPPTALARSLRTAVLAAALPAVAAAYGLDRLVAPVARRAGLSNAYRLVARRD
ncbi:methyltransferase type 12 [Streptomyces cinnamoneus]|uniref:Methyltransferase type 12 n=1 Tax=Streptomyces cinnamoneus TaxID=53446 RepID=A0A2G1XNG3_STRCJ|nr:class I SAM-dependent methyltransferase [Streptomyces cinnamoneus]PHQ52787.1 methyltransferase type 12 [Streptomyces cinnamoneus]PPT11889.1 class I SAM-dependent methyltransferase [Streptomyces cinnamoneus]